MNYRNRILSTLLAVALFLSAITFTASAADPNQTVIGLSSDAQGQATIGFSSGVIQYMPLGLSGVESHLNLNFGTHDIDTSTPKQTYSSVNEAGYTVSNESGGTSGYTVTVNLFPFDRGLEGASLRLIPNENGLISKTPNAQKPPILMQGQPYVEIESDGLGAVTILKATSFDDNPQNTALGQWGLNFTGDLTVYSNTILAGQSKAIMNWEIRLT